MNWINGHWDLIGMGLVIVMEQVLPHVPIRANSTVQLVIDIVKALLPKGKK